MNERPLIVAERNAANLISNFGSAEAEAEHLVVNVVACLATLLQQECLREAEGRLSVAVDEEAARDEAEDTIVDGGLVVGDCTCCVIGEVGEPTLLAHDLLGAHELLTLVAQHARVRVEAPQGAPVRRQRLIVVRDELRANSREIRHFLIFAPKLLNK